ncbi:MAG TPA: aquaporin Z [Xanthobacteraceae bacterium]|nr:aquaporin Z [Xanthobacteraceae bacterium]
MVGKPARKYWAEGIGTFWLVFAGIGTVLMDTATGNIGIAVAFGLAVLTAAYAIGRVSGGHYNPAVTIGLAAAGRLPHREIIPYVLAQLAGGILAAFVLWWIAGGKAGFTVGGFASNGYEAHSPGAYSLLSCALIEIVATAFFVTVILGVTARKAHAALAPLAIGFALTLAHLASLPVSGTGLNPARSSATAIVAAVGGTTWPLLELWLYWLAPLVGAALAGWAYREIFADE